MESESKSWLMLARLHHQACIIYPHATATIPDNGTRTSLSTMFLIGKSGAATDTDYNNGCAAGYHLNHRLLVLVILNPLLQGFWPR